MSIDLSNLPSKTDFESNNSETPPTPLPESEIYNRRLNRVQQRIVRFFSRTGGISGETQQVQIRTGFLTTEDKAALVAAIEGKGYTCVENNGVMTIN